MNKKLFILVAVFLLASSASMIYAGDSINAVLFPVKFEFNNQEKELEQNYVAFNYHGHTYVPARFVAEQLGAKVEYDAENKKVILNNTNRFNAYTVQIGDTIAGMEVTASDLNELDHDILGTIQFSGTALLSGTYSYSKNDALHGEIFRFTVDEHSMNRLPIMSHDIRTPWIVFSNLTDAKRLFGINDEVEDLTGKAAVVIDDFFINYQYKDVYNTAKLLDVYLHSEEASQSRSASSESMIEIASADDVRILANDDANSDVFKEIVVETKDSSKSFPWVNVMNPSYYPNVNLLDVDEDGKDEILIILTSGHGAGSQVQEIHVLNKEDLSELAVEDPLKAIESQISSTITKSNGNVHVLVELNGEKLDKTYQESDAGIWNERVAFGTIVNYEIQNNQLIANVPGAVSPAEFAITALVEYGPDLKVQHISIKANHE